jgi:hypothetical protein
MSKNPKNYIGFADDHSSSMSMHAKAAIADKNANIESIRNASTREVMDTIVYSTDFGSIVSRQIVNSNPHVLKPISTWVASGMTAFYDALGDLITQLRAVPDYSNSEVSFLVIATTDGEENQSVQWTAEKLSSTIKQLQSSGRWTFVLRVPKGARNHYKIACLGIPEGNIQEWDISSTQGMQASTQATVQGVDNYFKARSAGKAGSSSFFSDVTNVNVAALNELDRKKYSLYTVGSLPTDTDGMQIRDFILARRMQYLKNAAFYQFVKSEAKIGYEKQVLIRDRATGKVFFGSDARTMIGLPPDRNARVHPGSHSKYDIFIQSSSINRKLPMGTGVIYWEEKGVAFTQEEIDRFTKPAEPVRVPKEPAPVQLPAVNNTSGRPVYSNMPVQKRRVFFASRDDARRSGAPYKDNGPQAPKGQRWERM